MKNQNFAELVSSIRQAGRIKRDEETASRQFEFEAADIREIRKSLGLSQTEFAFLIGISVGTLQNWEQGRRCPEGPARALLRIAATHPEVVLEALSA